MSEDGFEVYTRPTNMRLPFRAWLLEQPIDEESLSLFQESFLCYQVGAYRAAVVFSYLGLLRIVAYRLMTASRPPKIPEKLWDGIHARIRDEFRWEIEAYDSVTRTQPDAIFLVDDDMRTQLAYWRGRRNDAAHSRGNEISAPHVESLWLFIRSNLAKMVVNGGRAGLLERFKRHFDPSFTPPGKDFSHLVSEIPQAVRPQEYQGFISDVLSVCDLRGYVGVLREIDEVGGLLFDHIVTLNDPKLTEGLISHLRSEESLLIAALLRRPNLILHLSNEKWLLRKIWHDLLPFDAPNAKDSLRVLAAMLRNDLIPREEQEDALVHVVGKIAEDGMRDGYPDELLDQLEPFGFFEAIYKHISIGGLDWIDANLALVLDYLLRYPVDRLVASVFIDMFSEKNPWTRDEDWDESYGVLGPEDAAMLHYFFVEHRDKYNQILQVAKECGFQTLSFERAMGPEP